MSESETARDIIEDDTEIITSHVMPLPSNVTTLPVTTSPVSPLDMPPAHFKECLNRRRENHEALMQWISSSLKEGIDFGSIPTKRGPSKPSLFKPGAEKICGMLGLTVHFPSLNDTELMILQGHIPEYVVVRCELRNAQGYVIAEGVGARSLKQDYGDCNKALKMSLKSAQIDACLRISQISSRFTQDIEDMVEPSKPSQPQSVERISREQVQRLKSRIVQLNLDENRVSNWVQRAWSTRLEDLPTQRFSVLWANLNKWATENEAQLERDAIQNEA